MSVDQFIRLAVQKNCLSDNTVFDLNEISIINYVNQKYSHCIWHQSQKSPPEKKKNTTKAKTHL
jgi:hypothetical protein